MPSQNINSIYFAFFYLYSLYTLSVSQSNYYSIYLLSFFYFFPSTFKLFYVIYISAYFSGPKFSVFSLIFDPNFTLKPLYVVVKPYYLFSEPQIRDQNYTLNRSLVESYMSLIPILKHFFKVFIPKINLEIISSLSRFLSLSCFIY